MGGFVDAIKGLFGGKTQAQKDQEKASQEQRDIQKVTQDRQMAELQTEDKKTTIGRTPRGRRLLINDSTGETGVRSKTLGG